MITRTWRISLMSLALVGLFLRPVLAGEPAAGLVLSLPAAIQQSIDTSEELAIQDNEVRRRQSQHDQQQAVLYPQISAEAKWTNDFEYPDIPQNQYKKDYTMDTGVTLQQTLWTFGQVGSSIAAAREAVEVGRLNKETSRQAIIYDAKIAYYNAWLTQRLLNIAEQSYENARRNKQILESRAATGRVSKYDNIKIASDIAARMPTVNNARAAYFAARETLRVMIGAEVGTPLQLTDAFPARYPDLDRDALALALYHNQPAIQALSRTITEKDQMVRSRRAAFLPEVSAFAAWTYDGDGNDPTVGRSHMEDAGLAGLKVSVPLWTGGQNTEQLRQARIDKNNAQLRYQQGQETYVLELDKAVNEYREYQKTLAANDEAIRWAEESFKLSQELFESGQVSVTDLNDAELQWTNQKMSRELTLFKLNSTLARIERLTLWERPDAK